MSNLEEFLQSSQSHFDAAKRLSDTVNLYAIAQPFDVLTHSWIAVKLEDGSTDDTLYESRRDAVRHQLDERLCAYLWLREAPGGMDVRAAHAFLSYHRAVYAAGFRLPDPDDRHGGKSMIMPITNEHVSANIQALNNAALGVRGYRTK